MVRNVQSCQSESVSVHLDLTAGRSRRARALLVCAFLVAAPVSLMIYVWKSFYVGTWMLAVTAFCIVVVVKVSEP